MLTFFSLQAVRKWMHKHLYELQQMLENQRAVSGILTGSSARRVSSIEGSDATISRKLSPKVALGILMSSSLEYLKDFFCVHLYLVSPYYISFLSVTLKRLLGASPLPDPVSLGSGSFLLCCARPCPHIQSICKRRQP